MDDSVMFADIIFVNAIEDEKLQISEVSKNFGNTKLSFFMNYSDAKKYLELNIADVMFLGIGSKIPIWQEQFEEIKLIDKAMLIVLISDNGLDAIKAYELQAFGFLLRPLENAKLERILRKALKYIDERNYGLK